MAGVTPEVSSKGAYHHGNLPDSLRRATAELIAERGPSGFSLREVARRAGVSHAAPAHHFGDTEGLMTSVACEGYGVLADALEGAVASSDDPRELLLACGRAYVQTAKENPGHFAVMISKDQVCGTDEELVAQSSRAYLALQAMVDTVRDKTNPDLDVDTACTFCWAAIQGLVQLSDILSDVADEMGTAQVTLEQNVEAFATFLMHAMAGGRAN